jgi:hypothetical protein
MNNYVSKKTSNKTTKALDSPSTVTIRTKYEDLLKDKQELIRLHTREVMSSPMFNSGVLVGLYP